MAAPIDPNAGLVRAFAEFDALPDLLAIVESGAGPPQSWVDLLTANSFTIDHIYDEDLPPNPNVPAIMAGDAWRLAEWLELVGPDGLADAGRAITSIAGVETASRTEAAWAPVDNVLADQIRALYLGADGTNVVDLVQAGARRLAAAEVDYFPGLLHVEFEALIHLAQTNPPRAVALLDELEQNRIDAMSGVPGPFAGVGELLNATIYADSIALHYLDRLPGHVDDTLLTLTASQATALLFVFCGLLEVLPPVIPIQYLTAPNA